MARGIQIGGDSHNNVVENNEFSNIWASAIAVGRGSSQNVIVHNSIQQAGDVFAAASAVVLDNTSQNVVSNNQIQNVSRAGVSDIRSDPTVKSGGNVIEHNTIVHSGQATDDSGAIYIAAPGGSSSLGDIIRFNAITDPGGLGTTNGGFIARQRESAGIYVDAGVNGSEISGNIIQGATLAGVHLQDNSSNQVHDNIVSEGSSFSPLNDELNSPPINNTLASENIVSDNAIGLTSSEDSLLSQPSQSLQALTVLDGAISEIDGISAAGVTFEGTTGTLKLDDAVAFTGRVSGLAGSDALDLTDISYGPNTTATFLGNASGGTLTVTDGTDTANITLQGNYLSSTWDVSSDDQGGTVVVDPVASNDWQTLKVGAGGFITGIDIAPDDTMVVRTDTYGAYIWNGSEWQQLVTSTSMPASFDAINVQSTGYTEGVFEIQIAPSNSFIMYMMYEGYVFSTSNNGTTWTQTAFAQVTEDPNGPSPL